MAKYNRKYMTVYLRNIYAVEMQKQKLLENRDAIRHKKQQICKIEGRADDNVINESVSNESNSGSKITIYHWIIGLLVSFVLKSLFSHFVILMGEGRSIVYALFGLLGIAAWICSWILIVICVVMIIIELFSQNKKHQNQLKNPQEKKVEFTSLISDEDQKELRRFDKQLEDVEKQIRETEAIQEQLYNLDIIPLPFRSNCFIQRLYKYTIKHDECDLDEEIRQVLIERAQESSKELSFMIDEALLAQYKQEKAQERLAAEQIMLLRNIDVEISSIGSQQEIQKKYIKMIESETQIAAFFAMG